MFYIWFCEMVLNSVLPDVGNSLKYLNLKKVFALWHVF